MAVYCVSDLHGDYQKYQRLFQTIDFSSHDLLYILGDVLDRGEKGIEILKDMMLQPNIIPILGNHEYIAYRSLRTLNQEISEKTIGQLDAGLLEGILEWKEIGGDKTLKEFQKLTPQERNDILDYLEEFSLYEEVYCQGRDYVLVHAGLDSFSEDRPLDDYNPSELLFHSPDYSKRYFTEKELVTGHLPTRANPCGDGKDRIYRGNGHIAIDCGCGFGGVLGVIRLDDGKEFYIQ